MSAEFPANWQELVINSLKKTREAEPMKAVFGVSLPESWKGELQHYARSGELARLLGVKAVSFGGKEIGTFDQPKVGKVVKEAPKSKKVG
jgi:hypothetical protein